MPQGVLYKIALLVLLSSLQPGQLQEEQPTADEGSDAGVAEAFDVIKALLSAIQSNTSTQIREFRSFRDEVKGDLVSLRADLSSLNDSVSNLSVCLQEHKQQTAAELAQLQTSLNTTQSSLAAQTQEVKSKLNTLTASLSQHKQQTAADVQQLSSRLDTLTTIQQCDCQQDSSTQTITATTTMTPTTPTTPTPTAPPPTTMTTPTTPTPIATPTPTATPTIPTYTCGGTGGWRRVVYLDMTDHSTTCPSGWQLTGYSKRTCGRATDGWYTRDSATFPVSGGEYSRVCGRIKAYQWGGTEAFYSYHYRGMTTIDGGYVAGISVTHSSPRQHIWTFAAGAAEGSPTRAYVCPCDASHTIRVPPFVGNDYFCESGLNGPWAGTRRYSFHSADPLWDGENCLSSSTCCSLHNPPYFVKQLPTPTTDDIEARICLHYPLHTANIAVELIELYVQ